MQQFTRPSDTANDEDLDDQCRKDVKAKTGFSSYTSFLEALKEFEPQAQILLKRLNVRPSFEVDMGDVFVLDVLKNGSTSISFERQRASNLANERLPHHLKASGIERDRMTSTKMFQNLQSPPDGVPARIVLWAIPPGWPPHAGIIEALGLALDIHPSFFVSLFWVTSRQSTPKTIRSNQVMIGDSIASVARNYRAHGNAPPVLIVVGNFDLCYRSWTSRDTTWETTYRDMVDEALNGEIGGSASLYRWATDKRSLNKLASMPSNLYLKLLSKHVYKGCHVDSEDDALLLTAMLPLLHIEILRLHIQLGVVDSVFIQVQYGVEHPNRHHDHEKQESYSILDAQRFWLRRRLECLEVSRNAFVKFGRSQGPARWLSGKTWRSQNARVRNALAAARAKDAEVRDYMHLQIGNSSIFDSWTTIQLSNQQIEEAKRVKIFTILAFVYVPLNLATSIFGMNLQQLNQSGQNVWSFVVTALTSLFATGFVWFSLDQYNRFVDWNQRNDERVLGERDAGVGLGVGVRMAVFLGLVDRDESWINR